MNKQLIDYVETTVFPKYAEGSGHSLDHIKYVIDRSLKFAKQVPDVNVDMCYVIAAYHDIGRLIDDDYHEKISAAYVKIDEKLKEFFTDDEINTIAEAIEDHRASSKHDPRSVYGKIVSSADRNTSVDEMIKRSVEAHAYWGQGKDFDKILEEGREHMRKKYGKNGYALGKMYFDDPDYGVFCTEVDAVTKDFETFKAKYEALKQ